MNPEQQRIAQVDEKLTILRAQLRDEQQLHIQTLGERDEAIEIARKAMGTVMQIYGHAQFCNECQSFEIADSCRSQMHDMDRINSLLTKCERNKNES